VNSTIIKFLNILRNGAAIFLLGFCLFPENPAAYALHLDKIETMVPGRIRAGQCAAAIGFALLAWWLYRGKRLSNRPARLLWGLTGIFIASFGITFAADPTNSSLVIECSSVMGTLAVGLLCALLCGNVRSALTLVAVGGVSISVGAIYDYFHHTNVMVSGSIIRAGGSFDQPLELGFTIVACLPLVIFLAGEQGSALRAGAWLVSAGVTVAGLMLTLSRGPIAAGAAACMYVCMKRPGLRRVIAVGLVFVAACVLVGHIRYSGAENNASTQRSDNGRKLIWMDGLALFSKHWVTGVGPGELEMPIPSQYQGVHFQAASAHASNLALQWLDELGVGGGVLLILFAWSIATLLRRSENPMRQPLAAAWIGIAASGIFDVPFGISQELGPTVMVGILLGATLMLPNQRTAEDAGVPSAESKSLAAV